MGLRKIRPGRPKGSSVKDIDVAPSGFSRVHCQISSGSLQPPYRVPYDNSPIVERLTKRSSSPISIHPPDRSVPPPQETVTLQSLGRHGFSHANCLVCEVLPQSKEGPSSIFVLVIIASPQRIRCTHERPRCPIYNPRPVKPV